MQSFLKTLASTWRRSRINSIQVYQQFQERKREELLNEVGSQIPFYRNRFRNKEWEDILPTSKRDIQSNFLDTVNFGIAAKAGFSKQHLQDFINNYSVRSSPWLGNFAMLAETTGTSGSKGLYFRTKSELAVRDAMMLGRSSKFPFAKYIRHWRFRRAVVLGVQPSSSTFQSAVHAAEKYSMFMDMKIFSTLQDPEKLAADLNQFNPHRVSAPKNYLLKLAQWQLSGLLTIAPSGLGTGGSALSSEDIELVKKAFPGVNIGSLYGATECSPIATTCRLGRMHQVMDGAILECLDRNNRPVAPGTYSDHVLVTSLLRHFQPIIRYRLDDAVKIDPEGCPCGSVLPVLHIKGRSDPTFPITLNDGSAAFVESIRLFSLFAKMDFVRHYQIISTLVNHFNVVVLVDGSNEDVDRFATRYREDIEHKLKDFSRQMSCDQTVSFEVRFERVDPLRQKDRQAFVLDHQ